MPYLQQHFSGAGTGWLCSLVGAPSSRRSTYSRFVTCPSRAPCSPSSVLSWVVRIVDPIFQELPSRMTLRSCNFLPNFVLFRAIQRRPEVLVHHCVQLSYLCAHCVVPCSRRCDHGWGGRCRETSSYPRGEEDCTQSRRRLRVSPAPLDVIHH